MTDLDSLIHNFGNQVGYPWAGNLAPAQRCWMIVYNPTDERRVRARIQAFENATNAVSKAWQAVDITDVPGAWIAQHPLRERYFAKPDLLSGGALKDFRRYLLAFIEQQATKRDDPQAVVAIIGVGALFGFVETSWLLNSVAPLIRGRLAVFFPGEFRDDNYRLLDAREGWNYLALPIIASEQNA